MSTSPETHLRTRLVASTAVAALIGDRLEPSASSEETTLPRVVYTVLSSDPQIHMGGGAGLNFLRIQYDIFTTTKASLDNIRRAFLDRLHGFRGTITTGSDSMRFGVVRMEGERDAPVPPTDGSDQIIYHRLLDFFVSCEEPAPSLNA